MRTADEYRKILKLSDFGCNKSEIALKTGIPRGTVRDCIQKFGNENGLDEYLRNKSLNSWKNCINIPRFRCNYAYLLGIYLGDGYIATHPRTYRLRIVLDEKYPNIISEVEAAINIVMPTNPVQTQCRSGAVEIGAYSNDWVEIFPQHGEGVKHERHIALEQWQQTIVDDYPIEFVRGLIHSDGTRIAPTVNGKVYERYQFSNMSSDIRQLFCETIEKLGLRWTHWGRNITIAHRSDVAFLDKHIGPKS